MTERNPRHDKASTVDRIPPPRTRKRPPFWLFGLVIGVLVLTVFGGRALWIQKRQAADSGVDTMDTGGMPNPEETVTGGEQEAELSQRLVNDALAEPQPTVPAPDFDRKLNGIGERLNDLEKRIVVLEKRPDTLETGIEARLNGLSERMERVEALKKVVEKARKQAEQAIKEARWVAHKQRRRKKQAPQVEVIAIDRWGEKWQAVVESNGIHILRPGSKLADWQVASLRPDGLTLTRDGRNVEIPATIER